MSRAFKNYCYNITLQRIRKGLSLLNGFLVSFLFKTNCFLNQLIILYNIVICFKHEEIMQKNQGRLSGKNKAKFVIVGDSGWSEYCKLQKIINCKKFPT